MTHCKFQCESVTQRADGTWAYILIPVTGGSAENEQFVSPNLIFPFEPDKTYNVDFTLMDS